MNLYFLVEGRRTEKKIYPKWLSHLLPELTEVSDPFKVDMNNFYLFNGNGFPSLLDNHLLNAVEDVNTIAKFNYFIICLDSDDATVEERREYVLTFIRKHKVQLTKSTFVIIVQNKCIETWFLGNRRAYSKNPQTIELRKYNLFFNVQKNDPELMTAIDDFSTSAQFHEEYLTQMLLEKKIRYSKKNPNAVGERHYLEELISRQNDTGHLLSLKDFFDFCFMIKKSLGKKEIKQGEDTLKHK